MTSMRNVAVVVVVAAVFVVTIVVAAVVIDVGCDGGEWSAKCCSDGAFRSRSREKNLVPISRGNESPQN